MTYVIVMTEQNKACHQPVQFIKLTVAACWLFARSTVSLKVSQIKLTQDLFTYLVENNCVFTAIRPEASDFPDQSRDKRLVCLQVFVRSEFFARVIKLTPYTK